ncbi:MAG: hypothetical protein E7166_05410 [Firmicutes bacterium]|nr:hypothetical protein [Bacillota bacterium]
MIKCVEGNINVGKTTFIKEFIKENNEYIDINETKFDENLSPYDRQLYYINEEVKKKENNKFENNIILDRSILSVYLYTLLSKELKEKEKNSIIMKIKDVILNQEILIPDEIIFIMYPFYSINEKHNLLKKAKKTQEELVKYSYYLNYNLFFIQYLKNSNIEYKNNRVIIRIPQNIVKEIYNNIQMFPPVYNRILLLDGAPATGKSTIGLIQKDYTYLEEQKYKKYTIDNYSNQIKSIIDRINFLKSNNDLLIDTSFLMGITHLFYAHKNKLNKEKKLEIINEIVSNIPLHLYLSNIIYLVADIKTLEIRRNNDKLKPRNHFYENMIYLNEEINFYEQLNIELGEISNITFIDVNNRTSDEVINVIKNLSSKQLILNDLFNAIINCIEKEVI